MKVKILNQSGSASEWNAIRTRVVNLGCIARDGDTSFNPEKASMVIEDGRYILKSRTDFCPKKKPYDCVITSSEFLAMSPEENEAILHGTQVKTENTGRIAFETASVFLEGLGVGLEVCSSLTASEPTPCDQKTLKVKKANVLVQNRIIFVTQSIPFLKKQGVDIIEDDGKYYTIDTKNNEATEITPEYVKTQAESDLVDGEDTPWTRLVYKFDLIDSLEMEKKVDDQ